MVVSYVTLLYLCIAKLTSTGFDNSTAVVEAKVLIHFNLFTFLKNQFKIQLVVSSVFQLRIVIYVDIRHQQSRCATVSYI